MAETCTPEFQIGLGAVALKDSNTVTFVETNYPNMDGRVVVWLPRAVASELCEDALREVQSYYDMFHDLHLKRISSPPTERLRLAEVGYSNGNVFFTNGLHRTAALFNAGAEIIPFDMDMTSLEYLKADGHQVIAWQSSLDFKSELSPIADLAMSDMDPVMCVYKNSYPKEMRIEDVMIAIKLAVKLLPYDISARQTLITTLKADYEQEHYERGLITALWRLEFLQTILPVIEKMHDAAIEFWQEGVGYPYTCAGTPKSVAQAWIDTIRYPHKSGAGLTSTPTVDEHKC